VQTAGAAAALALRVDRASIAADGRDLVIVGRDKDRLGHAASELTTAHTIHVRPYVCDLGRPCAAADLVAWDTDHEGAFALRLGALQPRRIWIGGKEVEAPHG